MFLEEAALKGERPFLWTKQDGTYRATSWRATAEAIGAIARGLRLLGIKPGERVGLISENRPEWMIADFGIMAAGAITVPAYTTNTVDDHRHILANSSARMVIVSTNALAARVLPAADQVTSIEHIITIDPLTEGQVSHPEIHAWADVMAVGKSAPDDLAEMVGRIGRDDTACLFYTSGTGGVPKGVMLSHANILANCRGAHHLLETIGFGDEVFLCFLPLSHSYEHTAGMMFPISLGAEIYFAEGAETLAANLPEARPTIMTAVPRLYETMHQRLQRTMEREGGLKAKLFKRALELGRKHYEDPKSLRLGERILYWMLGLLVRRKIRKRFGGRLKAMVSGGAPLNPEIGKFFLALGVPLLQGYGQTEAAPVVSANPPNRIKIETVGPPLDGVEVKIAEDGELLVRGECVMRGYWNDPEATQRSLQDGWLHTGDVAQLDRDGYISITDRKRDFIKNSGGDMVSPARIEGYLTIEPEIGQAMVYGDRRPYLVAVIVPHAELIQSIAQAQGGKPDLVELQDNAELIKAVAAAVSRVNAGLSPIERVRRFILAREPFTTANGQMTPTLKIKRHAIRQAYGEALVRLYETKAA